MVVSRVTTGDATPFSAVGIVRQAFGLGLGVADTIDVVEEIAKGRDGIGGTMDDILPMETVQALRGMLQSSVVQDMLQWVTELTTKPTEPDEPTNPSCFGGVLDGVLERVQTLFTNLKGAQHTSSQK